jgi:hypothetical protein
MMPLKPPVNVLNSFTSCSRIADTASVITAMKNRPTRL